MGSCCGCWKQELWQTGFHFSCYLFVNVHFLFCYKLCPKVNRLKSCLFKGLWKADQWDVPWRTLQTGGFQQKFRNLKSTFNLFQVLLEAVDKRLLFPGVDVMRTLGERDCLQTRHISAIESDGPGEYSATWEVLRELGLEKLATASDCRVIRWGKNNFQLCRFDKKKIFKWSKLLLTDTSPSALGSERPRLRRRELRVCSTRWTGGGTWRIALYFEEIFIDFE